MMKTESTSNNMSQELRYLILQWLGRTYLSQICNEFKLTVADRRSYDSYIESINKASISLDAILYPLPRETLKRLCAFIGIDATGKEKSVIINRIMDTVALVANNESIQRQSQQTSSNRPPAAIKVTPDRRDPIDTKSTKQRVFIVHGHDDLLKLEVARFSESLHLEPIILAE